MRTAEFRLMMEKHVHWQFQKLGIESPTMEARAAAAFYKPPTGFCGAIGISWKN